MIAPQRGAVRQEEMRDEHGLGAAKVRVRRHHRVARRHRLADQYADQRLDGGLEKRDPAFQVQPQVERDLLVPRSTGVQPAAGVADARDQLAFDERVDVLVLLGCGGIEERRIGAGGENLVERAGDRVQLRRRQHTCRVNRFRPRQASGHVVFEEAPIEPERRAETEEGGVGTALEPARPEMCHQTACVSAARTSLAAFQ
jgi:hypothetical protein